MPKQGVSQSGSTLGFEALPELCVSFELICLAVRLRES